MNLYDAIIRLKSHNVMTVSRAYFDGSEMVTDTTTYTALGRYVYKVNPNGTLSQVCEGLRPTGITLMVGSSLEATIRNHANVTVL